MFVSLPGRFITAAGQMQPIWRGTKVLHTLHRGIGNCLVPDHTTVIADQERDLAVLR